MARITYSTNQKTSIINQARRIGVNQTSIQTGVSYETVRKWVQRANKLSAPPVLCQCDEIATEQVRLSTGRDTWAEWLCPGCAELEREQQDLAAGRGEARRGLWRCAT